MRETAQSGPRGLQDAVPHRVGDQILPQDPDRGRGQVFAEQVAGGAEILPGLAVHGDWDRQGSCACTHGDPSKIQRELCSGDDQEKHEPGPAREGSVFG